MLTDYWMPLRYHATQAALWDYTGPYAAVVAGRGGGKTEIARRKIVYSLAIKKKWPDPMYFYSLPTYPQAKKVAWKPLLNLIPMEWIKGYNPKKHKKSMEKEDLTGVSVSDMCITTVFGSCLYVVGMDKPHRIEGLLFDGGIIDESSDQKPGTFKLSLLPTLTHRNPFCWRIGVPKRDGAGRVEFRAFFEKGLRGEAGIKSFHWASEEILTEEQRNSKKDIMTKEDYDEQYRAMWLEAGGTIYHAYSERNVSESAYYRPECEIVVGCDFNVDPMSWTLGHVIDEKLYVFDEIFIKNINTAKTLNHLFQRFEYHENGFRFFCDASASYRKSNADKTDFIIIKNDRRFSKFKEHQVFFFKKNPKLKTRFATVNSLLCNAKGVVKLFIHPKCIHLIDDMKLMSYKKGTMDPENYEGTDIGHISDGLGYKVCRMFPMRLQEDTQPVVITSAV